MILIISYYADMVRHLLLPLLVGGLITAGCAAQPSAPVDDGTLAVVASTNVWGDIAAQVGGDRVTVTSLISDPSQDPHTFQPSSRDALAVSRADVLIVNGGGYDDVVSEMEGSADSTAILVNAVQAAVGVPSVTSDNEHIWFDLDAAAAVADGIAEAYAERAPAYADEFRRRAAEFADSLTPIREELAAIRAGHGGVAVMMAEPLPAYLAAAAGLDDVTPPSFEEAMEEGVDVSPADLSEVLDLVGSRDIGLLIYNRQAGSAQGDQVLAAAKDAGVPVLLVDEVLPATTSYQQWMTQMVGEMATRLGGAS